MWIVIFMWKVILILLLFFSLRDSSYKHNIMNKLNLVNVNVFFYFSHIFNYFIFIFLIYNIILPINFLKTRQLLTMLLHHENLYNITFKYAVTCTIHFIRFKRSGSRVNNMVFWYIFLFLKRVGLERRMGIFWFWPFMNYKTSRIIPQTE